MANLITGLDIGSSEIKCVVAEPKKSGTLSVITAFKQPSVGIRHGVLVDAEDGLGALDAVVSDLQKISKSATRNVIVSFQSPEVKARTSRGVAAVARPDKEIQPDDIERVTQASRAVKMMPNSFVLHNVIKEYFVDEIGDIIDPLGMTGSRLEVVTLIVESFAPQVNSLLKVLEKLRVGVSGVIFNPLASANAVLSKKQKELGVLLVDFGAGTTSLAVFEEGKALHVKSLPVGSAYVTNDVAIGLKTPIDLAEKLKTTYGSAVAKDVNRRETVKLSDVDGETPGEISRHFLAEIIEVRLAEILGLVNNELKVLDREVQLPAGAVLTGGGVKLPGLLDLVKSELKLPVQMGFPNLGQFDIVNPTHKELLDDPEFSCAVGLTLWGLTEDKRPQITASGLRSFIRNLMP
jgi:cell division protein FtsA